MMSPNRNLAAAVRLLTASLFLFACVALCAERDLAQQSAPTPIPIDHSRAREPEKVDLGTGKFKRVYRNKDGHVAEEYFYEVTGSMIQFQTLVQKTEVLSVYPDGKRAHVRSDYFVEAKERTGFPNRYKTEEIKHDAQGNPVEKITEVMCIEEKDGTITTKPNIRIITTWPPGSSTGSVTRLQNRVDGNWKDLPGQPPPLSTTPTPADQSSSQVKPSQPAGTAVAQVHTRMRAGAEQSLLLTVAGGQQKIDAVQVSLPFNRNFSPGFLPAGWTLAQDGKKLQAGGPPLGEINLRFDTAASSSDSLEKSLAGKQIELTAMSRKNVVFRTNMQATPRPAVSVLGSLDGALTLPPEVTAGRPFLATPSEQFARGEWRLGPSVGYVDYSYPLRILSFTPTTPSAPLRFSYRDEFGETLIDADARQTVVVQAAAPRNLPSIQDGAPRAFAGQTTCVMGSFPDSAYWFELSLDGRQPLVPLAASPTSVILSIPSGATPGQHTLQWSCPNGTATGQLALGVLGLVGTIDQNELWRGQSTTMRLRIVGTEEALPLEVTNKTPGIIDIDGGVRQVVTTSGGADNVAVRSVRGTTKGNFKIDYRLDREACGAAPRGRP